jgi:hypothetical protein
MDGRMSKGNRPARGIGFFWDPLVGRRISCYNIWFPHLKAARKGAQGPWVLYSGPGERMKLPEPASKRSEGK